MLTAHLRLTFIAMERYFLDLKNIIITVPYQVILSFSENTECIMVRNVQYPLCKRNSSLMSLIISKVKSE